MKKRRWPLAAGCADAVFFDFGGTLVRLEPARETLFLLAAGRVGLRLTRKAVEGAYQALEGAYQFSSVKIKNDRSREKFYLDYNKKLCEFLGVSGSFDRLYPEVKSVFLRRSRWELFGDVKGVLSRLKYQGIPMAVVANWDVHLSDRLREAGILDFFSCVVPSQKIRVEKPDPAIFGHALNFFKRKCSPNKVIYVGNDYAMDVSGARRAGLVPVLIDRNNRYPHADCARFTSLRSWADQFFLKKKKGV